MTSRLMRIPHLAIQLLLAFGPYTAQGAEVSLVQGLFQKTKARNGLSATDLTLGARYSQQFHAKMYWFAGGAVGLHTYSSEVGYAPEDSTNISGEGGVRYYFDRIGERISPFGAVRGELVAEKTAIKPGSYFVETERNGIYYEGTLGLRLSLDGSFFVDLEAPLFRSALFAKETTREVVVQNGQTNVVVTSEASRYELFAKTTAPFRDLRVSLGMRF